MGKVMADLPVVCTLTPATIAARQAALLPGLVERAESREDTPESLRLKFPSDALSAILATVDAERQCCRFLRFEITVEPDGGPIWVNLAGPPGTREFLSALLES
jgi:2-methylcitrate dehydratase PrpD